MKKKINMFLIGIGALTIILTMVFSVVVFYNLFKTEVLENLKTYAHVLESSNLVDDIVNNSYNSNADNVRITLIASDGTVNFDSNANYLEMENHGSRPEVSEAL